MSEVLSPDQIESGIREIAHRIANGVKVCDERYRAFLEADRVYDRAFAVAYLAHEGPQTEKRYAAELETEQERAERDATDAAYRYADRTARALQDELRALQSVGASIRAMYQVAGRGES